MLGCCSACSALSAQLLCYGIGSVLQAVAARDTATAEGLDPRLLLRLAKSWRYVVGVGLDGLGFVLSIAAVRTLPLFVVQSIVASFLAITAIVGAIVLHMPLRRSDKVGLAVVIGGLVLVGLSAAEDRAVDVSSAEQWGVLVVTDRTGRAGGSAGPPDRFRGRRSPGCRRRPGLRGDRCGGPDAPGLAGPRPDLRPAGRAG